MYRRTRTSSGAEIRLAGARTTWGKWCWSVGSRVGLQARIADAGFHLMNNGAEVGQGGDGRNAGIEIPPIRCHGS